MSTRSITLHRRPRGGLRAISCPAHSGGMMLHRAPAFLFCSALWLLGAPTPGVGAESPPPDGRPSRSGFDTAPWPRHTIDASSVGADGVKLADVNRDGLRDIIT